MNTVKATHYTSDREMFPLQDKSKTL
uniref:APS n=1 Tax=Fasciola hepatica TaxID=6192 RepID=Q6B7I7_FASHE|nr:APS [Fasciola hepatica]